MTLSLGMAAGALSGATATSPERTPPVVGSYTSTDSGDGTYGVPLLNADVPDISVARVPASDTGEGRDVYYTVSTTMHLSPTTSAVARRTSSTGRDRSARSASAPT